jgi:hypothetical protein
VQQQRAQEQDSSKHLQGLFGHREELQWDTGFPVDEFVIGG